MHRSAQMQRLLGAVLTYFALAAVAMIAWAAPVVVLKSTSDAFKPGEIRDSTENISLSANEVVVVNGADGMTRRLSGPYSGPLGAPGQEAVVDISLAKSLSRLATARQAALARLGVIRSLGPPGTVNTHSISLAQSGTHCLEPGKPVDLLRPKQFAGARTLRLREMDADTVVEIHWRKDNAPTFWPDSLPTRHGRRYQVHFPEFQLENEAIEVRFVRLDPQPSAAALAGAMEDAGCRRQALIVLEEMLSQH